MSEDIVLVSGVRTAIGRFGGSFVETPASDLGAAVIREAVKRAGIEPGQVDQVVMGCVGQVAEDAYIARHAAIDAGLAIETPAYTVNRLCGSGLEAIMTAARWIQTGEAEIAVAGGTENMTMLPYYDRSARYGLRMGNGVLEDGIPILLSDPFGKYHMGVTAENLAEKYGITREDMDVFSVESHRRATTAMSDGKFKDEIVPIEVKVGRETKIADTDEHPRADSSIERMGSLRPAFQEGGKVTAGNASGINDGAAAVVMMTAKKAAELGLKPRLRLVGGAVAGVDPSIMGSLRPAFQEGGKVTAGNASGINDGAAAVVMMTAKKAAELGLKPRLRLVGGAVAGVDPSIMGSGPIPATKKAFERTGIKKDELDVIELNEAFASVALTCTRELDLDPERTNPNGGAVALGHPVGATGAILTVKLMHEIERTQGKYGLVSLCIGGGQGISAIFENVN